MGFVDFLSRRVDIVYWVLFTASEAAEVFPQIKSNHISHSGPFLYVFSSDFSFL